MAEIFLREDFARGELSAATNPWDLLTWAAGIADSAQAQDIFRDKEGRRTLRFHCDGRSFFLKLHGGTGWREIFKNLLQLRLPVVGASNEFRAVAVLRQAGVDTLTVVAYASAGRNPARRQSMIVTEDLSATESLEDYCGNWPAQPPAFADRLQIIRQVAASARRMHQLGINHRDLYLCHFRREKRSLAEANPRCYLIDLHRAQLRRRVPRRWLVKDLAGLYFSAMDCGLSRRDLLRFLHYYSEGGLREALDRRAGMWSRVTTRAVRLYRKANGRTPPDPGLSS